MDRLKGKKTYTAVVAGLAVIVGQYYSGDILVAEAVNQALVFLGIGGQARKWEGSCSTTGISASRWASTQSVSAMAILAINVYILTKMSYVA